MQRSRGWGTLAVVGDERAANMARVEIKPDEQHHVVVERRWKQLEDVQVSLYDRDNQSLGMHTHNHLTDQVLYRLLVPSSS